MNQPDAKPAANYVTCPCQHCSGKIEFDANQLDGVENIAVRCPHCELETILFAAKKEVPPIISTSHSPSDVENKSPFPEYIFLRKVYLLARSCFFGEGMQQDLLDSYKWIYLGESLGGFSKVTTPEEDEELDKIRDVLADQLSQSQVREAHRRADEEIKDIAANQQDSSEDENDRKPIPAEVRREVWRRDGGACVKCGSRRNLEYDHIVPVSKGGSNTARNIELLCEACNRSKSASIQ
jgi:5-methylcytosine-specific restriction endonuclease McrA